MPTLIPAAFKLFFFLRANNGCTRFSPLSSRFHTERDEGKEFPFSASFRWALQQVCSGSPGAIGGSWGWPSSAVSVGVCAAAAVFVALGSAAAVADEQHLIPGDRYVPYHFPFACRCAMTHGDSVSRSPSLETETGDGKGRHVCLNAFVSI